MIDWRRMQIKALHATRNLLHVLKEEKQEDELCEVAVDAPALAVLAPEPADVCKEDASRLQWSVKLWDGSRVAIDVSFFSDTQQSILDQIFLRAYDAAEKKHAGRVSRPPFPVMARTIDAMKLRIRDRIDEFNQLNRDELEILRTLAPS